MKCREVYLNVPYDGKLDNYYFLGVQEGLKFPLNRLYHGEKFGHTISQKSIEDIIARSNLELEDLIGEVFRDV